MNPYLHYLLLLCICTIVYVPTALFIGRNSILKNVAIAIATPICIVAFTAFAFALTRNYYLFIPALLSLFSTFVILTYFVKKPFTKLEQALQLLTDGQLTDLNIDELTKENNEVGSIARNLDQMVNKLNGIVSGMKNVSSELLMHSDIILNSSQTLADDTSIQAASTEEVSSSLEEAVSILEQTNANATKAKNISNKAAIGIESNFNQSIKTSSSIKNIYENINKINDISEATKILSLNASIEAARAGEHGKGFAVVASEVQQLADNSKVFSNAINELASEALETAETASTSLEAMAPEVRTTADLVDEISTGAMEQRQAINQISQSIQELNKITQNTSANGQEVAASAHQLKDQASDLDKLISFFNVH